MGFYNENLEKITKFFRNGSKQQQYLGLELEHFIVNKETGRSLPYHDGALRLLNKLAGPYGSPIYSDKHLIGITRPSAHLTLEPAGQFEISIGPFETLSQIQSAYAFFTDMAAPILDKMNAKLVNFGYHPHSTIDELELLPKPRYRFMDHHFKSTGTHGVHMMKGSGATQVSIDYRDEADFVQKFRLANLLGPLFAFICDNSPQFMGQPYRKRMLRTHIWNNVDPARQGVADNTFDENFGFETYAQYIYNRPSILKIDQVNGDAHYTGTVRVSELYDDHEITDAEIQHIASMVFPDVALKSHIEIRMADSMPFELALGYAAMIQTIFYQDAMFDYFYKPLNKLSTPDIITAKNELMRFGINAHIYGKTTKAWLMDLQEMIGIYAKETLFIKPMLSLLQNRIDNNGDIE